MQSHIGGNFFYQCEEMYYLLIIFAEVDCSDIYWVTFHPIPLNY
jgi:hypothetical protein